LSRETETNHEHEQPVRIVGVLPEILTEHHLNINRLENATKRNTEALIDVSKEVSLEVNGENTKYRLLSRRLNSNGSNKSKFGPGRD
jgi:hypothetical protein